VVRDEGVGRRSGVHRHGTWCGDVMGCGWAGCGAWLCAGSVWHTEGWCGRRRHAVGLVTPTVVAWLLGCTVLRPTEGTRRQQRDERRDRRRGCEDACRAVHSRCRRVTYQRGGAGAIRASTPLHAGCARQRQTVRRKALCRAAQPRAVAARDTRVPTEVTTLVPSYSPAVGGGHEDCDGARACASRLARACVIADASGQRD